jgi:uncharacterized protein (TIGR02246 family)
MKNVILKSACVLSFVAFTVTNVVCQSDNELKAKIEKLNKEMGDAMVQGNTEKSLSFYTQDAISLPSNEKMSEGKEAIRKSNEEMMKSGSKVTSFETTTLKVMSCGQTITEIGKYKISITMPGKTDPMNDYGKYLTIWEKQKDGSLKVKLEMWNSDINYMANMEKKQQ